MRTFLAFCFCFAPFTGSAQDPVNILLMNGKELVVYSLNDTSFTNLQFEYDKNFFRKERLHIRARRKAGKPFDLGIQSAKAEAKPVVLKHASLERNEVFSMIAKGGDERLLYYLDPAIGNDMPVESARAYALGARDARVAKSGAGWFYAGLGAGFVGGYATKGSIWAVALPPVLSLTSLIPSVSIPEKAIHDLRYQYNEDYALGFERQTRSRNLLQTLKGSVLGTVAGLVLYTVVDNN